MALFRKFFYRKPPDGLLEISERVYVFDCCFTTDVLGEDEYKVYIGGIVSQLREHSPDASFMVFNFREGEHQSKIADILSEYDMTVMDYPRHYEGCPLLTMEMIHHFLRSSESWLSLGQQNVLLMHCERGGWPVLSFMLTGLLIYRRQYTSEQKTLDMIYKQAPRELLQLLSPLNPLPSQLRYLQYISRRNVGAQWPPLDRALTLDCVILRILPNFDGEGGCRPIFRIYGQDPVIASDRTPKVLFSTPKKSKSVGLYRQADCELVKIDIHCHIQGDVVLECITLDEDLEREEMMFRVMFNTAFIRSNILILNRDEIDILWNAKDRFPKDFRAEVLLSEMDAAASLVTVELASGEEKEGLPVEAFAKVQEIFNNIDWVDGKGDAALHVLKKLTSSNVFQEKLDSVSLQKVEIDLPQIFSPESLEMLKERVKLDEAVDRITTSSPADPKQQHEPFQKHSTDSDTKNQTVKYHDLQTALHRPSQPKVLSQRVPKSLSTPVSSVNSLQGSPVPVSRYHSAPSALGITALLQDHESFMNSEVAYSVTLSPSAPSLAALATSGLSESAAPKIASPSYSLAEPKILSSPSPPLLTPIPSTVSSTMKGPVTPPSPPLPPTTPVAIAIPVRPPPPPPPPMRPSKSATPSSPVPLPPSPPPLARHRSAPPSLAPPPPPLPPPPSPSLQKPPQLPKAPPTPEHPASKHFKPYIPAPPPRPPYANQGIPVASVSLKSGTTAHVSSIHLPCPGGKLIPPPPPPPVSSSRPPPPPPPPPPPLPVSSSTPPSPPPPPPVSSSTPPPPPPPPPLVSASAPAPLPPPMNRCSAPPPPPPPSRSGSTSSAPPPPLPPLISSKQSDGSMSQKLPDVLAVPPPPLGHSSLKGSSQPTSLGNKGANREGVPPPPPNGMNGPSSGVRGRSLSRISPRQSTQSSSKKASLKPLHWVKVTRAMQGSLWAETQKADEASKAPEFDMSELESLFSAAVPNSDLRNSADKSSGRPSLGHKPDKVHLIDLRKANNCEIMLTKVKMPLGDLMSSVLALDDTVLDGDQVDNLIKFCPTKEEMELLKGFAGDKETLGKCEQYFLELMKVPRVESKLRVFSFKIQFRSQVAELRGNLNIVNSVAGEIRNSVKLKRIMQTILSLGNALNQGTARGSAIGFRLDSLLKLTDTRARNNKMTLMHYLCKVLADKLPELLDFPKDLVSLEVASKIQLKILAEEMQAISKGLEKVEQELTASENDGPISEIFRKTLKEFLVGAEADVRALTSLYSSVGRNADALALYFGEDPARCPFEQGMERGESSRPKRSLRERPTASNRARRLRNEPSQLTEPIPEQIPTPLIEASLTTPRQQATQTRTVVTQSAQATGIEEEEDEEEEDGIQQFPGGPIDISLLKSFKTHVAFEIWRGNEREPLKCMSKTYTLLEWKWWVRKDNETFRGYIMQSGLFPLIKCSYRTVDKILVSALVERWQPETNTFHMPFGEMSITLDDVFNILGIPITGSSVSPMSDFDDLSSMEILKKYLGVGNVKATEALVGFGGEYVRLEWLRSNFEKVSDSDTPEVIECAARAYLLYLVGCTIFTDKSGTRVNLQYLKFFTVLDTVSTYAWGSGCLAWLYRQLGYASRVGVKQIGGYLSLLQAWVYEHMYNLVKPDYDLKYTEDYPRACRWVPRRDSGTSKDDIQRLRLSFDMLKENEVMWDPYTSRRDRYPLHGIAFYTGMLKCCDVIEPYCPDRILRQFGRIQTIPSAPHAPSRAIRGAVAASYKVIYEYLQGMWENWENHVLSEANRSVPVISPADVVPGYYAWFHRVSHPLIHNQEKSSGVFAPSSSYTNEGIVDHALRITRPIVSLGHDAAIQRYNASSLFQAIESIQTVLEGSSLQDTRTYQRRTKRRSAGHE